MPRKTKPPPPEQPADELAYLNDEECWLLLDDVFNEGPDGRADTLATLCALIIRAIETNQSATAVIALHQAMDICFIHTRECDLARQLWKRFHLTDDVQQSDEPQFLLEGALKRSGVQIEDD